MAAKNPNSILFLFEGYTEEEFYSRILEIKLPNRSIRITKTILKGQLNINGRVLGKIKQHLETKPKEQNIIVLIAFDREGKKSKKPILNIKYLRNRLKDNNRIKSIDSIIATQDIESWFFHDYNGICEFLKIPANQRNQEKYKNVENLNNKDLSQLFKRNSKLYFKRGKKIEGFLDSLNLNLIYSKTIELQECISIISRAL